MKSLADLNIPQQIHEAQYNAIEQELIIRLDELDNVVTVFEQEADRGLDAQYKYPNRCAYVRDATNAMALSEREQHFPPDHAHVQAINAFIRGLNIVKAVNHVVEQKNFASTQQLAVQQQLQDVLQNYYNEVLDNNAPARDTQKHFKECEASFHTQILKILSSLNLTRGLEYPSDFIDLLEHYRNLASLLTPASSFVTKHKQVTPQGDVFYIDTAHPVTKKTETQREQIAVMLKVGLPNENEIHRNFHSDSPLAMQEASAYFAPLLLRDDTALGAQTRETTAPTAKNAFVVHNQILFPDGSQAEMFALRSASLAYTGKGETKAACISYANENLKQLVTAARELTGRTDLHLNLLLTNHFLNKQSTMVAISKEAVKENNISFSLLPVNLLGVAHPLEIAPEVQALASNLGLTLPPTTTAYIDMINKKLRAENAASVIVIISADANAIAIVVCASGQDRTGTTLEIATIKWIVAECAKHGVTITEAQVADARALGCHNAMLATLTAPGSAGMKTDSIPGYFSELVTKYFYRATAETNKHPTISHDAVAKILGQTQPFTAQALQENFTKNFAKISVATTLDEIHTPLINWANAVLHYQNNKSSSGVMGFLSGIFRFINKGTWAEEGLVIREATVEIAQALADSKSDLSETSFATLLKQITTQTKRIASLYPAQQRGTVFTAIEDMTRLTTEKLSAIEPSSQPVPNETEFKL